MRNREAMILNKIKKTILTSYGFIADPMLTPAHNASIQLKKMPAWHYFSRPSNLALHDLTLPTTTLPKCLTSIVGLGLKFCPVPSILDRRPNKTFARFRKDLLTKVYFSGRPLKRDEEFIPKMHYPSDWEPKEWDIPDEILKRLSSFRRTILCSLKRRRPNTPNLLPYQSRAITNLRERTDVLVVSCDKNLGPAIIDTTTYVARAYADHLANTSVYLSLTATEATTKSTQLKKTVLKWLHKYSTSTKRRKGLASQELAYLTHHLKFGNHDKFPIFYLTLKVHKSPWTTRPIVSCSDSLLYYLGVWVDLHLNKVATRQPSYLRNSKALVDILLPLDLPSNARLFISDATSMYTNIHTPAALAEISSFIHQREDHFSDIPTDALSEALALVMQNNIFQFGDTFWHQKTGAAMGTPPACNYANLFFACHEYKTVPKFKSNLLLYKRYIDDIIGIWIPTDTVENDNIRWEEFKSAITGFHGLEWIFSDRVQTVDYLDLTISIADTKIHTTLYEKELNLYLYIPQHSAHPPGVLTGLVLGNCHRIHTLCSSPADVQQLLQRFFDRLLRRGYSSSLLLPLFRRADELATTSLSVKPTELTDEERLKNQIFLHMEYHPNSIRPSELQNFWKQNILAPPSDAHLSTIENKHGHPIELQQMTIAYSRPPNLGNLLSSRNLHNSTGPPVSSYRK